jgi:glycosyltransferase involved in cell wall biosynthesis
MKNQKCIQANASVSVVIPCYNSAKTIWRAVESVAMQTVLPRELIIVDDGSQDNTVSVLREIEIRYGDWIKVLVQESNNGASSARNLGWDISSSNYIAFLDADDSWHPEKIRIQYEWMVNNPTCTISSHHCIVVKDSFSCVVHERISDHIKHYLISRQSILFSNCLWTPCVMLRREMEYRFDESKRYSEDYFLWLSIILDGNEAYFIDFSMTFLYKNYYGESGLSSHLWEMEKSELDNFTRLWRTGRLSVFELVIYASWSLTKFIRRLAVYLSRTLCWKTVKAL